MTRRRVLRIVLLVCAGLSLFFAISIWFSLNSDLSTDYFSGDALDYARYIWFEINLMLIALAFGAMALLIALRKDLLSWRSRPRGNADRADTIVAQKGDGHERDA